MAWDLGANLGYGRAVSGTHPLDRPILAMLTGARQANLAIVRAGARRLAPAYGVFAALSDETPESREALGAMVREMGDVALVEPQEPPAIPGARVVSKDMAWQMIAEAAFGSFPTTNVDIVDLGPGDAADMLGLATLTQPGPFMARTPELGDFVGVKAEGRLVAMAGERMKPDGMTEVSGVCTDPEYRGRGYAAALMRVVMERIRARGEVPFLHAYAANTGAIAIYERLGFRFRRELVMTRLTAA
ncbi:GNAT family N-acetyltransferase [Phenylobacterium sp.]|uniref:GNAT family N-acetyltransferase n=1 Tax=Phenylobacterium sp. TaxID=1871053 RepID=UPI003BA966C7